MKKNFFKMAFVSLFVVVALSSCKKDDDDDGVNDTGSVIVNNTITANFGNSYDGKIDVVKAETYVESENEYGYYDKITYKVAEAPYSNGGFTLQLPATVSDTYLDVFGDAQDGMKVSNPNVKGAFVLINAYKADEEIGCFYYGASEDDDNGLYYVNGDVSITGSYTDDEYTETYNVHFKKGWNLLYWVETSTHVYEATTKTPAGAKWHYDSYDSKSSAQGVSAKKTPTLFGKSSIRGLNKN